MSNTQYAFLKKANIPSHAALQASIDRLGFDMKVDPELNLLDDTGFSPCLLNGAGDFGFELGTEDCNDVTGDDVQCRAIASDNDICISMSWGSRMEDLACVMIVSCALSKDFGAVISHQGDEPESMADLLSSTAEIMNDIMADKEQESVGALPGHILEEPTEVAPPVLRVCISDARGKPIDSCLNAPDYFELRNRQTSLMELWVAGTITGKQRTELAAVDAAMFKLKNK